MRLVARRPFVAGRLTHLCVRDTRVSTEYAQRRRRQQDDGEKRVDHGAAHGIPNLMASVAQPLLAPAPAEDDIERALNHRDLRAWR